MNMNIEFVKAIMEAGRLGSSNPEVRDLIADAIAKNDFMELKKLKLEAQKVGEEGVTRALQRVMVFF